MAEGGSKDVPGIRVILRQGVVRSVVSEARVIMTLVVVCGQGHNRKSENSTTEGFDRNALLIPSGRSRKKARNNEKYDILQQIVRLSEILDTPFAYALYPTKEPGDFRHPTTAHPTAASRQTFRSRCRQRGVDARDPSSVTNDIELC
ncbi:hypothetical protein NPIL_375751 [Nephila pilipes]|uniref:Uncharacterized protein n=1 Tax=Nephila pilipes TaxID=299642 RepID=A0A8X6MVT3_NEPPI|nr:hypothetical protein NPIL_375751 [Nephila pilipes]